MLSHRINNWLLTNLLKKTVCWDVIAKFTLMFVFDNKGQMEEIWIIDDLIIDGNNEKNHAVLLETFDFGPKEENWLFYPGGNIGLYCPYILKGTT